MTQLKFSYNDGGRAAAGWKGHTHDCVIRSIAIVTGKEYNEVYNDIRQLSKKHDGKFSIRKGVRKGVYKPYLQSLGFVWVPTMLVGKGCHTHLNKDSLPFSGKLLVSVSKHLTTVIDGVINDTYDPSRNGKRCVYGYWYKNSKS